MIEAGFPITSPGDFEAVEAIARDRSRDPSICGLARTHKADIDAAWGAIKDAERPRIHTFISTSDIHIEHQLQTDREDVKGQAKAAVALAKSYCEDVEFSPMDATRAEIEFTAEVCAIAVAEGATVINVPDTVGYTTPEEYAELLPPALRAGPGPDRGRDLGPLPRRPGSRRRQLLRRRAGRGPPGRVRDQRDRRARRQLLAGGDRDADPDPRRRPRAHGRPQHPRAGPDQPHGLAPDRLRGAAEQGDRRAQRLRPRVRHPPGRGAEGAHHLRDHGRDRGRPRVELDRARQALRPPRPARRPGAARLQGRGQRAERRLQALQGDRRPEEAGDRARSGGDRLRRDAREGRRPRSRLVRGRGRVAARAARPGRGHDARPARSRSASRAATDRSTRSSARSRRPPGPSASCASTRSRR